MKKVTLALSVMAALGIANLAQAASTGTITFNGELTASTCDVSVEGQGPDATVVLPTLGTNVLDTPSKTAGDTRFVMALTNCAGTLQTASAYFEDGATVNAQGRLINSGTATNVDLQLLDGSGSRGVINVGSGTQATTTTYVDTSTGSASLPYDVRYFATAATTAGTVVSSVVYSLQYK